MSVCEGGGSANGIYPQRSRGQPTGDKFGDRNNRKKKEKIKTAWKVKLMPDRPVRAGVQ